MRKLGKWVSKMLAVVLGATLLTPLMACGGGSENQSSQGSGGGKDGVVHTISSSLLNVALNYVLIKAMGMSGAALATAISHGVQLTLHHIYCRSLGKGSYPFPVKVWANYAAVFALVFGFVYAMEGFWLPRWSVGALLGIFELLRIRKRKVLI